MKARFFGSPHCKECLKLFVLLNKSLVDYEYIDITNEDKKLQDLCDDNKVDEVPHLQLLDNTNTVVVNHIGLITEEEFICYLATYFPNY